MFKATNKRNNEDIIILDPQWIKQLNSLRQLDRQDDLICPGCQQPVRVRAGKIKRWHFAHKHLADCPLSHEAAIVLEARAILYVWLISKFKEAAVSLEKELENESLSRPVDCWVQTQSGNIAYWIIPGQVKPDLRKELHLAFEQEAVSVNWIFLSGLLREEPDELGYIHLTTTERVFMQPSQYSHFIDDRGHLWSGPTLHYLSPTDKTLTTFRVLHVIHKPQLYSGRKRVDNLTNILVQPKTGEFVHPGEHEYLQKTKKERERIQREMAEQVRKYQEQIESQSHSINHQSQPIENKVMLDQQEGTCLLCEQIKSEWGFVSKAGERICLDCYGS